MSEGQRPPPRRRTRRAEPGGLTVKQLSRIIRRLPAQTPIAAAYERAAGKPDRRVWYADQREHLLGWLAGMDGPGAYGRQRPVTEARLVWNRLRCPTALLWLTEAAGCPPVAVRQAKAAALAVDGLGARCAAIRRILPWPVVTAQFCKNGQ